MERKHQIILKGNEFEEESFTLLLLLLQWKPASSCTKATERHSNKEDYTVDNMLIEFTTGGLSGVSGDEKAMRTHCLIPGLCLFMELVFNVKCYLYLACVTDLQRPDFFNGFVL